MRVPTSLRPDRRGVAATELAILTPLLLIFLFGTVDVSNSVQTSMRLERAARVGAVYALADSTDMNAVRGAVIAAWPALTTNDVPLPVLSCQCVGATVTCTASCPSGLVRTVTVTATRTLVPRLITSMNRSTGNAVARLQ